MVYWRKEQLALFKEKANLVARGQEVVIPYMGGGIPVPSREFGHRMIV